MKEEEEKNVVACVWLMCDKNVIYAVCTVCLQVAVKKKKKVVEDGEEEVAVKKCCHFHNTAKEQYTI